MVETRRSSASTKRPLSSPTTSDGKRSKEALETTAEAPVESKELGSEAKEIENRLVDPMVTEELKVSDGSDTLMVVEKDGYDVDKDEALPSPLVTKGEGVEAEKAMKSDTKVNRVPTRPAKIWY